jgi:hypothetical protein
MGPGVRNMEMEALLRELAVIVDRAWFACPDDEKVPLGVLADELRKVADERTKARTGNAPPATGMTVIVDDKE